MNERRQDCWYKNVCQIDDCTASCIRYNEIKYLMDTSGIPVAQQIPLKLKIINPADEKAFLRLNEIKNNIVNYVENGNNLYITSNNTGNGKTSWALKIILKYFDEIWSGNGFRVRGLFIHVPTFLSQIKNFNNPLSEEFKENVVNADIVIWDDIASNSLSPYDYGQLLMYIDARIMNKRTNIYTSNIADKEKLDKLVGARLSSRIYTNSEVITLIGKDYRSINDNLGGINNNG